MVLAHRWVYAAEVREPEALNVLHSCDNPPCCNPAHLFAGTQADNVRDCAAKGRRNQRRPIRYAKLSPEVHEEIGRAALRGEISQRQIAQKYGVSQGMVSHIKRKARP